MTKLLNVGDSVTITYPFGHYDCAPEDCDTFGGVIRDIPYPGGLLILMDHELGLLDMDGFTEEDACYFFEFEDDHENAFLGRLAGYYYEVNANLAPAKIEKED